MFSFDNIIPMPLKSKSVNSDIWLQKFSFDCTINYFIEAPSGSGKTTFQHLLYGLRKDYDGDIHCQFETERLNLRRFTINDWSVLRRQYLSAVFQDLRLFLDYTARENLRLKNVLTNHKTENQIEDMCASLGIAQFLDKKMCSVVLRSTTTICHNKSTLSTV